MKPFIIIAAAMLMLGACSDKPEDQKSEDLATLTSTDDTTTSAPKIEYENQVFEFDAANIDPKCDKDSQLVCALDLAIKCTLNPKMAECDKNKLPGYIFFEDENLGRPTKMSYRIYKLKPLDANMISVYTEGTCNGNLMGLCQGNIIYVMGLEEGQWQVKDTYAAPAEN